MDEPEARGDASAATAEANRRALARRDYADREDFARAERGFLGTRADPLIRSAAGEVVWNLAEYEFLGDSAPPTVHPGLWRQEQINARHGLFQVADGIYQVRGFDLSNVSFVAGESGWIVIDPLTCAETARAAVELLHEHVTPRPVAAVVYSHSHMDHFGGVKGVVRTEDVRSGDVRVIAPDGFLEHAVSENIYVGAAMARRSMYQFGNLLAKDAKGYVGCGIGKSIPIGQFGLIAPTDVITATGTELVVDGVRMIFQNAPDSEAPAEMNFFLPERGALCIAENCAATLHNLLTLRGAQVRDPLLWSKYLDEAIELWGDAADVLFMSHNWPRWGTEEIVDYIGKQRDMYRYIHDQTVRLANRGYTMDEVAEMVELPDELSREFFCGGYYGTVNSGCKAVYQRYLGWFDGNPANLHRHPPEARSRRYVDAMGGPDAVLTQVHAALNEGDYRWAAELGNHLVFACPDDPRAREAQAAALEQLGYQAESGIWRSFYLSGAHELRHGPSMEVSLAAAGRGVIPAMTMDMLLDALATRLDGPAAAGVELSVNFRLTDVGEDHALTIANSVLRHRHGVDPDADATLIMERATLDRIAMNPDLGYADMIAAGKIQLDGDIEALIRFGTLFEDWRPDFPIVTP